MYGLMYIRDYYYFNLNLVMVVVYVVVGNFVYVRIGFIGNSGYILSNYDGYFIFFGWIID